MMSVKTFLLQVLIKSIGSLPLTWARALGALSGRLAYRLNQRSTQVTRANLRTCFPNQSDSEREQWVARSMIETGKTGAEICVIWSRKPEQVLAMIKNIEGEELLKSLLAQGKGLVVLAPHLGNWEALGFYLARLAPMVNMYQPPKNASLDPIMHASRKKAGSDLAPTSAKGVAALLKNLKAGGICGVLPDQTPIDPASGIHADFFGNPALTITLVQKLLNKTQCAAVFAYAERVQGGFSLKFREADQALFSEDVQASVNALNQGVESLVLEKPWQYQWEYKRFRKRPEHWQTNPYEGIG